jgi:hypothetical protein
MRETARGAGPQNQVLIRNFETALREPRKTGAALLTDYVVLLAMKQRCAPLPVSRNLRKRLLHGGVPNSLDELGNLARRYLFLGDARMLLAELRMWPKIPTQRLTDAEGVENRFGESPETKG